MIYSSVTEIIGKTPLVELKHIQERYGLKARLVAKLECMNPAGSVKDRAARKMIEDAEERGILRPGSMIIEPTSGNTGIGLASVAAGKGYRTVIVMPDTMSLERRQLMKAYGAELVLTEGSKGMQGAIEKAQELQKSIPDSMIAGQFENPANAKAHYETTGPEIYADTQGELSAFVATVGTGGTITGTGRYLKEQDASIAVIAVEPKESAVLSGGQAGSHRIQGIGAGFVPQVLDTTVYDEVLTVSGEDAYAVSREIAAAEGVLVGISSGAAVCAAIEVAKRAEYAGKTIVVLLPDSGSRYLSSGLYEA